MAKKKHKGTEAIKRRNGQLFLLPWSIGFILFFLFPLAQSLMYSFSEVKLDYGEVKLKFKGLENFRVLLFENPDFIDNLTTSITKFIASFPVILILSLVLAIMLNQKFKGRLLFRAMYFLPVIIASGVVMEFLMRTNYSVQGLGVSSSLQEDMFSSTEILDFLGLPPQLETYFLSIMGNLMTALWNCGIQIILFISGMQAIPDLLYEVALVEGATKWEEFWYITFPQLSRVTVLVIVFTTVEMLTSKTDVVMETAYSYMQSQMYAESSAMLWIFFAVISSFMGLLILLFNRFCMKRWD